VTRGVVKRRGGSGRRTARHDAHRSPSIIDPRFEEAITHFVRVLARSGCKTTDIERIAHGACRKIPKSWSRGPRVALSELKAVGHLLTLWWSDPAYVDSDGHPRALPLTGSHSIKTLLHRVDPRLNVRRILQYPLRSGVLRRVGSRYLPRERMLVLKGADGLDHPFRLGGLFGLLRTLDENRDRVRGTRVRFQAYTISERFPVRAVAAFEKRVHRIGRRLAFQLDTDMHRITAEYRPGEPTLQMGIGFYQFVDEVPARVRALGRVKVQSTPTAARARNRKG
jgi:hypothetical protein